jgi:hypothetical protein
MNSSVPVQMPWPPPGSTVRSAPAPVGSAPAPATIALPQSGFGLASVVSLAAGFLTSFTISLVGEMPISELLLLLTAGWAVLVATLNHALPGPLFHLRFLRVLLVCQGIAFVGYIIADLYWHSALRDVARGWSRMIFLAIDVFALTYLFGRSRGNLLWFIGGQAIGDCVHTVLFGALFGDTWKFGYGLPITYGGLFVGSFLGPLGALLAAGGGCVTHFLMDFRSAGGLCAGLAGIATLQLFPRGWRVWLAPLGAVLSLAAVITLYEYAQARNGGGEHASRSDIERSAMIQAAGEAFLQSPFIGHGSWFSRSHVYENFALIRDEKVREARVGGFAGANDASDAIALHSQILVALAEGGILGGAFFIAYGLGLLCTLWREALYEMWRRETPVRLFVLLLAVWNLLLSPFSGAHRVNIAMAVCLMLVMQAEASSARAEDARP